MLVVMKPSPSVPSLPAMVINDEDAVTTSSRQISLVIDHMNQGFPQASSPGVDFLRSAEHSFGLPENDTGMTPNPDDLQLRER